MRRARGMSLIEVALAILLVGVVSAIILSLSTTLQAGTEAEDDWKGFLAYPACPVHTRPAPVWLLSTPLPWRRPVGGVPSRTSVGIIVVGEAKNPCSPRWAPGSRGKPAVQPTPKTFSTTSPTPITSVDTLISASSGGQGKSVYKLYYLLTIDISDDIPLSGINQQITITYTLTSP